VPSHNFADYHDKPILYYWLTSLAYAVAGVNELGARLVSALAATATLVITYAWAATVWSPRIAGRAVLVLVTSAGFLCLGRYGSLDMLLAAWLTVGLLAAERYTADPSRLRMLLVAAAAAGCGMLTKGLVAPIFIATVPAVHAYLTGRRLPPRRALGAALAVFVVVAGPWYVAAGVVDPAYLREFFLVHHLTRFTSTGTTFHAGPWWYYAPALALIFFPWSPLLPAALATTIPRPDPALRYCLCWAGIVIGLFSLSHGKLATYVLPALPPLAMITAYAIDAFETGHTATRRLVTGGLVVLTLTLAAAAPVALHVHRPPWDGVIHDNVAPLMLFPAAAAAVLVVWWRRGPRAATTAIAASAIAIVLAFYLRAAPMVSEVASEHALAQVIATHAPDAPIVSYEVTTASLMFYVGRPIVRLNRSRALRQLLAEQPFTWIVTSPRHVEEIADIAAIYPWVTTGRHVLYATAPPGSVAEDAARGAHD
jgi:4-amino-4-deoxy-L-arabinose transferase-like glycosyltransferase